MNKRLLIITGELSGLNSVLPSIEELSDNFWQRIKIISPDYSRIRETMRSEIRIPSLNGLIFNTDSLKGYFNAFFDIIKYIKQGQFTDVMFVDNPDFNLLLTRFISRGRLNLYYYIIPQVWAWRKYRIKYLKKFFKKIFVIFPFEKEYLKSEGIDSVYVGHPIIKLIENLPSQTETLKRLNVTSNQKIISLFPGTRPNVLKRHFFLFEQTAKLLSAKLEGYKFVISDTNNIGRANSKDIIYSPLPACEILNISNFSIISSGSTTIEATSLLTPFVGVYKPDLLTYNFGRILLKKPYTVMPNIILNRQSITEIIGPNLTAEEIAEEVLHYLQEPQKIQATIADLKTVKTILTEYQIDQTLSEEIRDILA